MIEAHTPMARSISNLHFTFRLLSSEDEDRVCVFLAEISGIDLLVSALYTGGALA
jgi:hypothetical protein